MTTRLMSVGIGVVKLNSLLLEEINSEVMEDLGEVHSTQKSDKSMMKGLSEYMSEHH